ncbi:uncharacterized protein BYT42DRAFT_612991 [Radiomyces spectabilis]|uniref:uncharacterized protein n=1 Tax=Radiomyces spectabilis TaxID=64574 RepID=UPI00221F32EF|nr:uncharacterized protein BYT42DRAFT_612991 [Radiomyces spectabilis]KAI8381187.1 hypothetical protein BYT42DRAFT_612991 [Radiomyces spectabilis]
MTRLGTILLQCTVVCSLLIPLGWTADENGGAFRHRMDHDRPNHHGAKERPEYHRQDLPHGDPHGYVHHFNGGHRTVLSYRLANYEKSTAAPTDPTNLPNPTSLQTTKSGSAPDGVSLYASRALTSAVLLPNPPQASPTADAAMAKDLTVPPPAPVDANANADTNANADAPSDQLSSTENAQADPSPAEEDIQADQGPSPARPPVAQVTGCRTHGQIAVTYSEGPSDATARIVRQLNNANARANFFVNATWLYTQQYAMVLQNIYNAGHFIGMMYRVKNDDSSSLTDNEIRDDILKNARTIEALIKVSPKYVRLHYTKAPDARTQNILSDLGFILVGYNLDSQDYSHKVPVGPGSIQELYKQTFQKQKETYDAKGSFISVQYDIPDTGALVAVPHMINTIDEEGYTMVRLDGCLNDPKPYKKDALSKEYVSDKFSFGTNGYHSGQNHVAKDVIDASIREAMDSDIGKEDSGATSESLKTALLVMLISSITFMISFYPSLSVVSLLRVV